MTIQWREILSVGALLVGATGIPFEVFGQAEGPAQGDRAAVSGVRSQLSGTVGKKGPAPSQLQRIRVGKDIVTITRLNSVVTASPAESFALSGNYAYVCDDNEISVIDVSNPAVPQLVATALSQLIRNSANIHCAVQRNTLIVFADQTSSLTSGPGPGVSTFNLSNPLQPVFITALPINKRFFEDPVYVGNYAFAPISALTFFQQTQWDGQYGDLLSIDLNNFSSPALIGTLEQPQVSSIYGGQGVVLGATSVQGSLLYVGGSTSTGGQNNGSGRLQVVDVSVSNSMQLTGQLLVPNTILFSAPLVQDAVAVGIGNTGGYGEGHLS